MRKEELRIEGFLVDGYVPSEAQLQVSIDATHLTPQKYSELVRELQDILHEIDEDFAKRQARMRRLDAKYRRIETPSGPQRTRHIKFTPLPMRFTNELKYIKTKYYWVLDEHCLVLQRMARGQWERNLYLVPYERAEALAKEVENLNREIDELNEEISSPSVKKCLDRVEGLLAKYDLKLPFREFRVESIRVGLTAVKFDYSIVEEWAEKSPSVAALLDNKRREVVEQAIKAFTEKIKPIIDEAAKKAAEEKHVEALNKLKSLAESVGLHALANTVITPLINTLSKAGEKASIEPKWLDARIRGLLKSL